MCPHHVATAHYLHTLSSSLSFGRIFREKLSTHTLTNTPEVMFIEFLWVSLKLIRRACRYFVVLTRTVPETRCDIIVFLHHITSINVDSMVWQPWHFRIQCVISIDTFALSQEYDRPTELISDECMGRYLPFYFNYMISLLPANSEYWKCCGKMRSTKINENIRTC